VLRKSSLTERGMVAGLCWCRGSEGCEWVADVQGWIKRDVLREQMAMPKTSELKSLDLFSAGDGRKRWCGGTGPIWRRGGGLWRRRCWTRTANQGRARASINACIRACMHGARQAENEQATSGVMHEDFSVGYNFCESGWVWWYQV
jgi:hypothetical protein